MAVATPDWLSLHGCSLHPAFDNHSYLVTLGDKPQYLLKPVPLEGKFGCTVTQTINGKRLDSGAAHPTIAEALRGGLDDLQKALGW
jgi:hypothetical protein